MLANTGFVLVEGKLAILSRPTGATAYDFDFSRHFECRHPHTVEGQPVTILRLGAPDDYLEIFREASGLGLRPINDPDQHLRASELECWYPLIHDITPRSRIFAALPDADEIEAVFGWPVFLKGSRQTSKHAPELSVIRDRQHYAIAASAYARDPILHWQKPVVREYMTLAPVPGKVPGKIDPSLEFRTFWLGGACVGCGPYWYQVPPYRSEDIAEGLALAAVAASRVGVPFLVVDIAKTADGRWIVIECNDGQESGHAGIPPQILWRNVLDRI